MVTVIFRLVSCGVVVQDARKSVTVRSRRYFFIKRVMYIMLIR